MISKYKNILVTGGAGFIGSHLVDGLVEKGYRVRIVDNLDKQVHRGGSLPDYLNPKAEFIKGDVTSRKVWEKALEAVDAVYHFASAVGVGQSMYQVKHYVKANSLGTAVFLDILANHPHKVKKIIVAASMSSYGEGSYKCKKCGKVKPPLRENSQLAKKDWSVYCPKCKREVKPTPTDENTRLDSNSIYAISKKNQEEMVLTFGKAYSIPCVSLRFFNVYGTRQSLSNPYTGVVAIFASRIKNGSPPLINEDGQQTRDFIHVSDVVSANIAALENESANYQVFNVGVGKPVSIRKIAEELISLYKGKTKPEITLKFRKGDVRHCFADNAKIKKLLFWKPKVSLRQGLEELIKWSRDEKAIDRVNQAMDELSQRGLR